MQLIGLIKENYTRLESGVKKTAYIEIAKQINLAHNLNLSYDKIDSKWKGLKKTYKKIKDDHNQTGQSRRYWEYYDVMNEILHKAPEITPPAVLSTEDESVQNRDSQDDSLQDPEHFAT